MTFYSAVKQTDAGAQPVSTAPSNVVSSKAAASLESVSAKTATVASPDAAGASQATRQDAKSAATTVAAGAFVVQIAAVTREEDAAALAGALRKKSYNVFVVNNPTVHDKLYHVQVGPFSTAQDADAMKAKLTAEGYNPIVKRS
jgi:cell division septation protein DedD